MNIFRYVIPFYQPDIYKWSLEARLLRWLTFLWLLIGLIALFSASYAVGLDESNDGWFYFKRQVFWMIIGLICFKSIIEIPIQSILKYSPWFYMGILFLIFGTVIGLGQNVNGAERWIAIGPIQVQPSELLKPFLVLQAATIFAGWKRLGWNIKGTWLGIFAFTLACILKQPNLSTTSLCGMTLWLMALAGGLPYSQLVFASGMGLATGVMSVLINTYQLRRITSFTDPWSDARGDGYQLVQSLLAIGSGGQFGVGFGMSQQKLFYLPFQYTDFIFAVFAEEFGLVGCTFFLILLGVFATLGLRVAMRSQTMTVRLVATGATILLVGQAFLNIGVASGALPTTGLPFPMLSYGGNAMLASLAVAGLLVRSAREMTISEVATLDRGRELRSKRRASMRK